MKVNGALIFHKDKDLEKNQNASTKKLSYIYSFNLRGNNFAEPLKVTHGTPGLSAVYFDTTLSD
jgi:hypothetical protein